MKNFIVLLFFSHIAFSVKHSLKYFNTASTGVSGLPEFVGVSVLDEIQEGYCNSNKEMKVNQDWVKQMLVNDPEHLKLYSQRCFETHPKFFKASIYSLTQRFNQSGDVHFLQSMSGCEWDDETGEINGFNQYGYDGEDFISFDIKTQTWIAAKQQAVITKLRWDTDKARIKSNEIFYTQICQQWLKSYVDYRKSYVQKTDLPSVSLLQKTPSSPVSCHATGFYSDRAEMFWRKDGEEIHEDVDHGEILPNNDGTFQLSVDLKLSSVKPEDWSRYDCVFQLSGVKDGIITKLDKAVIRTNSGEKPSNTTIPITAVVIALVLMFLIAVAGFMIYKKKKDERERYKGPDSSSEVSEELNPEN